MKTKTTVIHHSADYDGIFCREIARASIKDCELIGWDFADPPLPVPPEGDIYIVDLPVDRVFGFDFSKCEPKTSEPGVSDREGFTNRLIWIDHHKSSIDSHPEDLPGYRIDGVAACRLLWQWFKIRTNGDPLPTKEQFINRSVIEPIAVRLAGEYDIWDKRDPDADLFQYGLRSQEITPSYWNGMFEHDQGPDNAMPHRYNGVVMALLEQGKSVRYAQQTQDKSLVEHRSFIIELDGIKFLCLNTGRYNSLTFESKDVPETGHDALMGFAFTGKLWTISMYHAKHRTDLDLSKIAVKHGGGGHRGACGFTSKDITFLTPAG